MTNESHIIHRIVERSAGAPEWEALEILAADDQEVWSRLLTSIKHDGILREQVESVFQRADAVALPAAPSSASRSLRRALRRWAPRVAAILVISLALVGTHTLLFGAGGPAERPVEATSGLNAAGGTEVLGEYPHILIRSVPHPGGGFEVVSIRPVVERRIVEEAFQLGQDATGSLVATAIPLPHYEPPSSL